MMGASKQRLPSLARLSDMITAVGAACRKGKGGERQKEKRKSKKRRGRGRKEEEHCHLFFFPKRFHHRHAALTTATLLSCRGSAIRHMYR